MAPPSSAQCLVSLARGTSSSQLKERALSALCASTSGSSVSGPGSNSNEPHVFPENNAEQAPKGAPAAVTGSAIRAWLANKGFSASTKRLAGCTIPPLLGSASGLVAQSIGSQSHSTNQFTGSRPFATAAVRDSDPTFDEFLSGYKNKKDADEEEEALRKSMAAIKQNLSVPGGAELGPEAVNKFYTFT